MKRVLKKYFIPHEHNEYKPHFLRQKSVLVVALVILLMFVFSILQYTVITKTNLASIISSVLVDLTNRDRENNNLQTLTVNPLLTYAAQMKADDMASKGYFSHTSPDGIAPWYWFWKAGYSFEYAGENLAVNFSDSENVERTWMNSAKHRENILNNRFAEIGIATAKGIYEGRETIFVVQLFGKPVAKTVLNVAEPERPALASETEETNIEIIEEEETFIVVKGLSAEGGVAAETAEESSVSAGGAAAIPTPDTGTRKAKDSYASFPKELAASPQKTLSYFYIILGGILLTSLALFVAIEIKRQYPKHIVYALLLIILMAGLVYINHSFIFPQLAIR